MSSLTEAMNKWRDAAMANAIKKQAAISKMFGIYGMPMRTCSVKDCKETAWSTGPEDDQWRCPKHQALRREQLDRLVDVPEEIARRLIR